MSRERAGEIIAWTAALLLCAATVMRFEDRGGPYLSPPATVLDRVGPRPHDLRDALVVLPEAEALIPRGATVAVVRIDDGEPRGDSSYLAAVGLLPHHRVLPPFTVGREVPAASLPEYVVALNEPFRRDHYVPVAGFPRGWLYRVER